MRVHKARLMLSHELKISFHFLFDQFILFNQAKRVDQVFLYEFQKSTSLHAPDQQKVPEIGKRLTQRKEFLRCDSHAPRVIRSIRLLLHIRSSHVIVPRRDPQQNLVVAEKALLWQVCDIQPEERVHHTHAILEIEV